MENLRADAKLIARCGLYCGACRKFLRGSCPGCAQNSRASWCKVRNCCQEHGYTSCANCEFHSDPGTCHTFNNLIAKLFGLVFNSNRAACIAKLRVLGPDGYAEFMAFRKCQSLPRRGAISLSFRWRYRQNACFV
jgi:hypothetical protein